jgi:hypothetical protein
MKHSIAHDLSSGEQIHIRTAITSDYPEGFPVIELGHSYPVCIRTTRDRIGRLAQCCAAWLAANPEPVPAPDAPGQVYADFRPASAAVEVDDLLASVVEHMDFDPELERAKLFAPREGF